MLSKNSETFIACDAPYGEAKIAMFGAGSDSTTSFRPGARFAPKYMRAESYGMETFSPYQNRDMADCLIIDPGDLDLPFGDSEATLRAIQERAGEILKDGKLPFMMGGEHLVSLGAVRACAEKYAERVCAAEVLTSFFAEEEEFFWYGLVLSGFIGDDKEDENDSSAILYLEYAGRRFLFPGDVSSAVERELVTIFEETDGVVFEVPVKTSFGSVVLSPVLKELDFLKASHHGSADATSAAFCEYVLPQTVFFSSGAGRYRSRNGPTFQ